ncbi:hypothetical protein BRADI_2g06416v3 [Brachypodium distachyon]|uniref:Uncharacterized protein n=1 Tax=Brachypodium distachyon TaxID=15368 RepID=A0A0Q3JXM9_BRADI|nr:hypothetical protein BRADI_2g06416v3 [Brachypodium distachyon]
MASPRAVTIALVLFLVLAASPNSLLQARMVPGETAAPAVITTTSSSVTACSSSSLQEELVQRPPLPLPPMTTTKKITFSVVARRSSRMLGSVPSPGVGH